jgi:SNF2 family DNA or RNA helicase
MGEPVLCNLSDSVLLSCPKIVSRFNNISQAVTYRPTEQQLPAVTVSENLLKPIPAPVILGRDYSHSAGKDALFDIGGSTRRRQEGRKAYKERMTATGTLRQTAGIWELILPLLKPPLNLAFPLQIDLPFELYAYQVPAVQKLVENNSFLLADEMGTGKTVMASVALRILFQKGRIRKALIVCPKSALQVWDSHLEDWAGPSITCTRVSGSATARELDWKYSAHVYVTTYDTLRNDVLDKSRPLASENRQSEFDLVILDEAHHIRNPAAGRSRAVAKLTPRYRWALSGTPLQNRIEDLAAIFRFVKPGLFPKETPSPAKARELIQPFFLRRRKMDVLPDLPEKIHQPIWLEMDPSQKQAYEETMAEGRSEWKSAQGSRSRMQTHIFAMIQKLKQICNFAPGQTTSPKLECLLEQIDEIVEEHKACVFTQYVVEGVSKLREHLSPYGLVEIRGATSAAQRERAIESFQNDPAVRIFLATTSSAGEGITLTAGNYVFHFDQWWNPARAWQAEDRLHRAKQKKQVTVYSYWMEDTYEERIFELLERKGLLHEEVINAMSEKEIEAAISMEEWCGVLGLEMTSQPEAQEEKVSSGFPTNLGEIYQALQGLSPSKFEEVVALVFKHLGYANARVTGKAYDGGVDIQASRNAFGGVERIVVQCKRKSVLGVEVAREFFGAISADQRISKGFLAVSGKLSQECRRFVSDHGNLSALEGIELAKLIAEYQIPLK